MCGATVGQLPISKLGVQLLAKAPEGGGSNVGGYGYSEPATDFRAARSAASESS